MKTIGNLFWFLMGGFFMGISWYIFGALMFLTVVGIPWGKSCFTIGTFAFFPFGKEAINRKELTLKEDIGTGKLGTVGNIVWFLLAGFWLGLGHLGSAIACAVTVVGIPFAIQHLKLAGISLAPVGKTIVGTDVAQAARATNDKESLNTIRSA